ncbi:scytonemin biosynthesis cyclase/decarboxylase ScyC [Iningainema tapete]|uniref:Scytonemin biosynthesis cyclase/decarboxylase ScyC n=1 Tax=Iningainema tapete BLCC-T55 TaxID=2748662 RepID=A0A8J7BZ29_9CYAN|nr:scytonemin biosynthesis cyclase/decarboxylase ScyC [Iningainema tapete]MBD2775053.1 scytonemin biosynthesis cyclase/decarboxylase ScyC [Iningainema tapete BLCC-T55]
MVTERNTFATSAYIATTPETAYEYLCSLKNLDEWTLYSRMREQIDEDTWVGTASGYQTPLYYHVKRLDHPQFYGIEWHCGLEYQKYYQVYPVLLFPANYIEPGTDEKGVYLHWISFVDPKRRSPLIMEGIHTVHTSECRSLKGNLERKAGLKAAAQGRYYVDSSTMYVNAPVELAVEFLSDLRNMDDWAHLLHADGEIAGSTSGEFRDEYDQKVKVTLRIQQVNKWYLVEHEFFYPDYGFYQRCPLLLMPTAHVFQDPQAPGFILHQIAFWKVGEQLPHGKLQIEDFGSEQLNIKRLLEGKAGNLSTLAQGLSYMPDAK